MLYPTFIRLNSSKDAPSVEDSYSTVESLDGYRVIYNEKLYTVVPEKDIEKFINSVHPQNRTFHEVIFCLKQKIRLDIDAPLANLRAFRSDATLQPSMTLPSPARRESPSSSTPQQESQHTSTVSLQDKFDVILLEFIKAINYQANLCFGESDFIDNMIIFDSSDINIKFSAHILVDSYYVQDNEQAREFYSRVIAAMPPDSAAFADSGVYKLTQNFRMLGSHKTTDKRDKRIMDVKRITDRLPSRQELMSTKEDIPPAFMDWYLFTRLKNNRDINFISTLVGSVQGCVALNTLDLTFKTPNGSIITKSNLLSANSEYNTLTDADHAIIQPLVLKLCEDAGLLKNHRFRSRYMSIYMFNRSNSEYCDICERQHDSDNTLYVFAHRDGDYIKVRRSCMRYKQEHKGEKRSLLVGYIQPGADMCDNAFQADLLQPDTTNSDTPAEGIEATNTEGAKTPSATPAAKTRIIPAKDVRINRKKPRDDLRLILDKANELTLSSFDSLPEQITEIYEEPTIRPLPCARTLIVQANMKMGKTKALSDLINTHFADTPIYKKQIVFLSFRCTFSNTIKEKFSDWTLYSDVTGELEQDKLIVQIESLWRYRLRHTPPDLLILDECESIFEQLGSKLSKNFEQSWAVFKYLMAHSRHVVMMDAYITDRTYQIGKSLRNSVEDGDFFNGLVFHRNKHRNQTDETFNLVPEKSQWYALLFARIESGNKIVIPATSHMEAKIIQAEIRKRFPEKNIKLYSSATPTSEKKTHFADVKTYWSQYDCIIYTPTVSAGVSFEEIHFDELFAYFTDNSCCAEVCWQMIGRVRNLANKRSFVYMNAHIPANPEPELADEIKTIVYSERRATFNMYENNGIKISYQRDGTPQYYTDPYFDVWLENTIVRNRSRNDFRKRFITLGCYGGTQFHYLTDKDFYQYCNFAAYVNMKPSAELVQIKKGLSQTRNEIVDHDATQIASADDISDEEAEAIREMMQLQKDMTAEQYHQYEKYKLRKIYHHDPTKINIDFVKRYSSRSLIQQYSNLCRMYTNRPRVRRIGEITNHIEQLRNYVDKPPEMLDEQKFDTATAECYKILTDKAFNHTSNAAINADVANPAFNVANPAANETGLDEIDIALERLRAQEMISHLSSFTDIDVQVNDINKKYVFERHRTALALLRALGWVNLRDDRKIHPKEIEERSEIEIVKRISADCASIFKLHDAVSPIGVLGRAIESLYGLNVKINRESEYELVSNKAFLFEQQEGVNKPIIRSNIA